MTTLEEKLEKEQLIYQQNYNDNLLKNESKKKTKVIFTICGFIILIFEIIFNVWLIIGMLLGLGISGECDDDDWEKRKECEEQYKKDERKYCLALYFFFPCLFFTCIIMCLYNSYNKKIIVTNFICIIIKFFLYIGYLINLTSIWTKVEFLLLFILIFPEITSDLCFIISGIIKYLDKN